MNDFIKQLNEIYSHKTSEDGIILETPIMYAAADHSFSFFIKPCKEKGFTVTDRGQTMDYLRENVNPSKYEKKIERICKLFGIELIEGEFVGKLASLESGQTMRNLHTFIGTMNIIANVDML